MLIYNAGCCTRFPWDECVFIRCPLVMHIGNSLLIEIVCMIFLCAFFVQNENSAFATCACCVQVPHWIREDSDEGSLKHAKRRCFTTGDNTLIFDFWKTLTVCAFACVHTSCWWGSCCKMQKWALGMDTFTGILPTPKLGYWTDAKFLHDLLPAVWQSPTKTLSLINNLVPYRRNQIPLFRWIQTG